MNETPNTEREAAWLAFGYCDVAESDDDYQVAKRIFKAAFNAGYSAGRAASTADVFEKAIERVQELAKASAAAPGGTIDILERANVLEILEDLKANANND